LRRVCSTAVRRAAHIFELIVCEAKTLQTVGEATMSSNLLDRKASHFVLWRPRHMSPPPRLVIGKLKTGNPPTFVDGHSLALEASPTGADLWEIPAAACGLTDGDVYHYWFEVTELAANASWQELARDHARARGAAQVGGT
jgi:hypothetical protein